MIWLIVGYMWLFLHRPFEIWTWMGTLRVERIYMIVTIIAWLTIGQKQFTENKINFAIGLFVISMVVSTVMCPYSNITTTANDALFDWFKYVVFYVLVMTCVKNERDLKILMTAFTVCFFIYLLHSYREYLNGRYKWAMGTKRMVGVDVTMSDPNTFGASVVIMTSTLLPVLAIAKKKWHYLFIIGYFLLSLRCVQLTGSRSSLMALLICLVGAAVVSKKRHIYIPLLVLGGMIMWATMTDNLRDRYSTLFDSSINEGANESAAGRWKGFEDGITHWQRSPIWGIGPDCHGYGTGEGFYSHCLYGQIPGELGSLGIAAFLGLLFCFTVNHISIVGCYSYMKIYHKEKEALYCYRLSLGVVAGVVIMLLFGLAGHNGYRYTWVWFAAFQAVACSILSLKAEELRKRILANLPIE